MSIFNSSNEVPSDNYDTRLSSLPILEDSKTTFFRELDNLNQSTDEDDDSETDYLRKVRYPDNSGAASFSLLDGTTSNSKRSASTTKKVPPIQRTSSAPIRTTALETPAEARKTSLLRYDISVEATPDISFAQQAPVTTQQTENRPVTERRTVSTPSIGSVSMTNSLGIANMLKKHTKKEPLKPGKKGTKRKAAVLEMKPENERIFNRKVFYYIPNDDVAPLRKQRIDTAIMYGAVWAREWTSSITHVVVESNLSFQDISKWLREQKNVHEIPTGCILVNETYPLECAQWACLLDHDQPIYRVKGHDLVKFVETLSKNVSPDEPASLQIKDRNAAPENTPSQTDYSDVSSIPALPKLQSVESVDHEQERPSSSSSHQEHRSFGSVLDEIIQDARKMPNLDDDDDDSTPGGSPEEMEESGSEGERAMKATKRRKVKVVRGAINQASFSCMKGGTGLALDSNPNKRTIELLQAMADYYERIKDQWRTLSYRKAIGTLKQQTQKISTYEEAIALSTIGERLAKKIEEIAQTNRLERLDFALKDSDDDTLQLFMKIYGAGVAQADKWIRAGHKTLEDLVKSDALTTNQKIGVEHYDDFNTRIPRDEVTALGEIVKAAAAKIDPGVEVIIGGSYRRGAKTSGDIDCLITKPGTTSSNDFMLFLHELVTNLTNGRFLVAALAVPSSRDDSGSKWHGACVLPDSKEQIWRRIDFLLVPATEFGAALIYFTGNDIFNRSLRLLASKKQMRLNQRGLYKDVIRGSKRVKLSEGTLVEGADERKIFQILGVPWREPEDRIPN